MSFRVLTILASVLVLATQASAAESAGQDPAERGRYLVAAAGCQGCHTVKGGEPFAGGRAIETAFGTFFGPNITPDPEFGIGGWSDADFLRALREGVSPDGDLLYPAFPYASFTGMTDEDILAIKAYLFSLKPVAEPSRPHELDFPYSIRAGLALWRALYFEEGPLEPDPEKSADWNRGAYLVRALGHCGECHTPRDALGGPETDLAFAGTADGPDGAIVPNITPDKETGIGGWSAGDLDFFFTLGMLPDGDVAGDVMYEVIQNTTSELTGDDRAAMIAYLRDLPAIRHQVERKKP